MNKVSGEILEELRDSMVGRRYRHFKGESISLLILQ